MLTRYKLCSTQFAIGFFTVFGAITTKGSLFRRTARCFHQVAAREQILETWRKRAWARSHKLRNILASHRDAMPIGKMSEAAACDLEHLEIALSVLSCDGVPSVNTIEGLLEKAVMIYPDVDREVMRRVLASARGEDAHVISRLCVLQGGKDPYRAKNNFLLH